mmetsp:Transcript_19353/g.49208  ORF Transcript_19353/g.49208 Transcript_19353/m.49208 type:complete len:83 (-) Transcript_19353:196-444(-)
MAANTDRVVGVALLLFSVSLWFYYTFWVIITPFIDPDHFIQAYFPPRLYAVLIPVVAGAILLTAITTFLGLVMIKAERKKTK